MFVRDFLQSQPRDVVTIARDDNVLRAMKLLLEHRISCLPVTESGNRLVGIISDKDIFRAVYSRQDGFMALRVADLMTTDLIVGVESDSFDFLGSLMTKNRIRHIPIVEGQLLIGLVSIGDVVKASVDNLTVENRYLRNFIDGTYPG